MELLLVTILLALVYAILLRVYFKLADRYGILDIPNNRSSHAYHTIRGAGIIFPVGMLAGILWGNMEMAIYFSLALMALSVVSFIDDVKGLSSTLRFMVHVVAGLLLAVQLWPLSYSYVVSLIVVCAVVVFVNGFNFMDGINGITGIYSMVILTSFFLVNHYITNFINAELIISTFMAVAVFGFFNFRKRAVCFAGDVGSVTMAFLIVFMLSFLMITSKGVYYLVFVSVYLIDFGSTILHRIWLGEKISEPHRKHLYQLLVNEKGHAHMKVAGIYGLVQFFVNVIMVLILINYQSSIIPYLAASIILVLLTTVYLYFRIRYFHLHTAVVKHTNQVT